MSWPGAAPHREPSRMSDVSIISSSLSFAWPDGSVVFEDLSFTVPGGRTGLVAPNGAGKSTLLRLIAGEYSPGSGDVVGVAVVVDALGALAAGDFSDAVFTTIGDDWDVEERSRAHLARLGLGKVELDRR